MFVRFLFVFDLWFNLFRIALWPSVGKELSPWFFTCAVFILVRLNCRCPLPVWCLGQDVEFDCICSWSLPFYLSNIAWISSTPFNAQTFVDHVLVYLSFISESIYSQLKICQINVQRCVNEDRWGKTAWVSSDTRKKGLEWTSVNVGGCTDIHAETLFNLIWPRRGTPGSGRRGGVLWPLPAIGARTTFLGSKFWILLF